MKGSIIRKYFRLLILLFFLSTTIISGTYAGNSVYGGYYTDYQPQYTVQNNLISLDKIEYCDNATVFFFRFRDEDGTGAVFCGKNKVGSWQLIYGNAQLNAVRIGNVRVNGELRIHEVNPESEIRLDAEEGDVFTCEIQFPAVPSTAGFVNLVQGGGGDLFNFFSIKIKSANNEELGSEETAPAPPVAIRAAPIEDFAVSTEVIEDSDDDEGQSYSKQNSMRFTLYSSKGRFRKIKGIQKKQGRGFETKRKPVKFKGTFRKSFGR
ncbi:MAG: hypothetical protein KKA07_15805 [Bacteroidetes bacterium]|nr:hypothetical protein [Bacteroidota bacterium]MBU1720528.1 hypothetical protein [Bacteroidota bacterium]